jgi:hypothetical protein
VKPLFTIHAGEYIAAEFIEHEFRRVNIWVPAKDTGVDLLVSDARNKKAVSLQVKFSRDFRADMAAVFQKPLRACGWWSLNRKKITSSPADYWVFVLIGFATHSTDFVILKPSELLKRFDAIREKKERIDTYLWVTENDRCWETRGLNLPDRLLIAQGDFKSTERDFTAYLNNWQPIKERDA